jgi:hypothetical protein
MLLFHDSYIDTAVTSTVEKKRATNLGYDFPTNDLATKIKDFDTTARYVAV